MRTDHELHDRIRRCSGTTPPLASAELVALLAAAPPAQAVPASHRLRSTLLRAGLGAKVLVAGLVMATATATAAYQPPARPVGDAVDDDSNSAEDDPPAFVDDDAQGAVDDDPPAYVDDPQDAVNDDPPAYVDHDPVSPAVATP